VPSVRAGPLSIEPLQVAPLALAALAFAWRARALRRRARPLPARRAAFFLGGIAVMLAALVSPLDRLGEERLFSMHMAQHVLLGDVGPLLVVLGLSGPLLRPLLARSPVRALRLLAHPLVSLPLWALDLCLWHLPYLYDAALRNGAVHALEHALFFACGALVWAAVVEPLPGPAWFGSGWKLVYVGALWVVSGALANVFIWSGRPFYAPYVDAPRTFGLSALSDQRLGGAVMLLEGSAVAFSVAAWIFLRHLRESELRQALLEGGAEPAAAARAARYGRAAPPSAAAPAGGRRPARGRRQD
jgi:putative membrane protein